MRGNLDILRQKIIDELFVLSIFEVSKLLCIVDSEQYGGQTVSRSDCQSGDQTSLMSCVLEQDTLLPYSTG